MRSLLLLLQLLLTTVARRAVASSPPPPERPRGGSRTSRARGDDELRWTSNDSNGATLVPLANDDDHDDDTSESSTATTAAADDDDDESSWNSIVKLVRGGGGSGSSGSDLDRSVATVARALCWVTTWRALVTVLVTNQKELAIKLLSQESVEAVKTIKKILADVHDEHGVVDIFAKYRKSDILMSVYALNRLQNAAIRHERTHEKQQPNIAGAAVGDKNEVDKQLLDDLAHYSVYANAVYGWKMDLAMRLRWHMGGDLQALVRQTGVERKDVVVAEWESRTHRPAYFIIRDRRKKSIVLCVRGTWSPHDLLTDLCCTPQDFESSSPPSSWSTSSGSTKVSSLSDSLYHYAGNVIGRAKKRQRSGHHGMLEAARGVQRDAEAVLAKELEENPDFSLVLVGHSLGGGVAALLGTLLERSFPNLKVYCFGAPCVAPGNSKLHRNIVSVVAEGDPFRCLSLGHVADVTTGLASLCEDPMLRNDILLRTNVLEHKMHSADLEWCFNTMNALRIRMNGEKLYPPGRILLLSGALPSLKPNRWTDRSGATLREVPAEYFRDLVVGPRMIDISKHIPALYESTLRALADASANDDGLF